jgi:hypothetical protein
MTRAGAFRFDRLKLFKNLRRTEQKDPNINTDFYEEYTAFDEKTYGADKEGQNFADRFQGIPDQVVQDLRIFGLTPPASINEVRKARNR